MFNIMKINRNMRTFSPKLSNFGFSNNSSETSHDEVTNAMNMKKNAIPKNPKAVNPRRVLNILTDYFTENAQNIVM